MTDFNYTVDEPPDDDELPPSIAAFGSFPSFAALSISPSAAAALAASRSSGGGSSSNGVSGGSSSSDLLEPQPHHHQLASSMRALPLPTPTPPVARSASNFELSISPEAVRAMLRHTARDLAASLLEPVQLSGIVVHWTKSRERGLTLEETMREPTLRETVERGLAVLTEAAFELKITQTHIILFSDTIETPSASFTIPLALCTPETFRCAATFIENRTYCFDRLSQGAHFGSTYWHNFAFNELLEQHIDRTRIAQLYIDLFIRQARHAQAWEHAQPELSVAVQTLFRRAYSRSQKLQDVDKRIAGQHLFVSPEKVAAREREARIMQALSALNDYVSREDAGAYGTGQHGELVLLQH